MSDQSALPSLSFWERDTFFPPFDVVIVGSGIVGLSAALHLRAARPGLRLAVLERGVLPAGASTRNAGFACFGSMTELLDDLDHRPETEVWSLVARRWQGLQRLRARLGDEAIQYREWGGYELFRAEEKEVFERCQANLPAFNDRIRDITGRSGVYRRADDRLPAFGLHGVNHLLVNQAEGQIHTGRMMEALLRHCRQSDIPLYNGIGVDRLEPTPGEVRLITDKGWVLRAARVLVATNGFATRLLPDLPVQPARNQVLITRPVEGLPWQGCFHYDRGYFYFRNVGNRVLLGGGRHLSPETERTDAFGTTTFIRGVLRRLLTEVILPGRQVHIEGWWSGILGIGAQKTPIVQWVDDRIAVAVRLGGMGVAIGSLTGEEGAELLLRD